MFLSSYFHFTSTNLAIISMTQGKSNEYDIADSPEPGRYNSKLDFDSSKARDPKYTFGAGGDR